MRNIRKRCWDPQRGADTVEYALLLVLLALVVIAAVVAYSDVEANLWYSIQHDLEHGGVAGGKRQRWRQRFGREQLCWRQRPRRRCRKWRFRRFQWQCRPGAEAVAQAATPARWPAITASASETETTRSPWDAAKVFLEPQPVPEPTLSLVPGARASRAIRAQHATLKES